MSALKISSQKLSNVDLPPQGHPDRKRVLNILAQRRYRQRKQNKIADLEAKIKATVEEEEPVTTSATTAKSTWSHDNITSSSPASSQTLLSTPDPSPPSIASYNEESKTFGEIMNQEIDYGRTSCAVRSTVADLQLSDIADFSMGDFNATAVDFNVNFDDGSIGNAGGSEGGSTKHVQTDATIIHHCNEDNLLPSAAEPKESISSLTSDLSVSSFYDQSSLNPFLDAFADDSLLQVPSLKVVKAATTVTQILGIGEALWNPSIACVLELAKFPVGLLPAHYQPTESQQRIPHHPFIDILPWPSVRNKLIWAFSQPPQFRPPSARDPMAVMLLAMDVDDDAEGVRIAGSDGLDERGWEVGQTMFKNWWWAFSRSIIENSNRLRLERGAGALRLEAP